MIIKQLKIFLLIAVFFLSGYILGQGYNPLPPVRESTPTDEQMQEIEETVEPEDISLMLVLDELSLLTAEVAWEEGLDLFNVTKEVATSNELDFEYKDYDEMGILITRIGDKINGEDEAYWQYWINNEQALVAANSLILEAGDVVTWQFRQSAF